jgi:hypothetical protein
VFYNHDTGHVLNNILSRKKKKNCRKQKYPKIKKCKINLMLLRREHYTWRSRDMTCSGILKAISRELRSPFSWHVVPIAN